MSKELYYSGSGGCIARFTEGLWQACGNFSHTSHLVMALGFCGVGGGFVCATIVFGLGVVEPAPQNGEHLAGCGCSYVYRCSLSTSAWTITSPALEMAEAITKTCFFVFFSTF